MQTSNDLLKGILTVLIKIDKKLDSKDTGKAKGGKETTSARPNIFGMGEIAKEENKVFSDTAKSLKDMGNALKDLSTGMDKFRKAKGKNELINFINDIIKASNQNIKGSFKEVANSMLILSQAMSPLASGIFKFGIMQKIGLVTATEMGIRGLITTLSTLAPLAPLAVPIMLILTGLGTALDGLANVLKSIGIVMLSFATSILILVGAVKLTQVLFGTSSPWEAMAMVFGIMVGFAGMFATLAIMSPLIIAGGIAVAVMGAGLTLIGIGLISFLAATWVMSKIGDWKAAIFQTIAVIGLLGLAFAGLGILSPLIIPGAAAAERMGWSSVILSIGVLAFAGTSALLQMMGLDFNYVFQTLAVVGLMALAFSVIGILSPLIIAGSLAAISMSLGITILSIGLLAFTYLASEINNNLGPEGIESMINVAKLTGVIAVGIAGLGLLAPFMALGFVTVSMLTLSLLVLTKGLQSVMNLASTLDLIQVKDTISQVISSTFIGVISGISNGLLGEDGQSKGFFGKVGAVAKNTAILMGGIGLVMSTAMAVSMLGLALRAFTTAGTITVITGYDKDGKPIYGPAVDISKAAENIAVAIGSFFTTLSDSIQMLPSLVKIDELTAILTGYRPGILNDRPSLMGTIIDFGNMLSQWATIGGSGGIPTEIDKNGKVLKTATFTQIASAIAQSINAFMFALSDQIVAIGPDVISKAEDIARILGGEKRLLRPDKPGIMDPLLKFSDMILEFASGTITITDEKGKEKKIPIDYVSVARTIANSIITFSSTLAQGLSTLDAKALKKGTEKITGSFEALNIEFEKIIKNRSGIEKAADSIGKFGVKIGELATSLNSLDTEKLAAVNNLESSLKIEMSKEEGGWYPGRLIVETIKSVTGGGGGGTTTVVQSAGTSTPTTVASPSVVQAQQPDWGIIGQAIGQQVADALRNGQFKFEFSGTGPQGVFYLEPH